jgi:glucose-1-phosphate thymidylyltransferase
VLLREPLSAMEDAFAGDDLDALILRPAPDSAEATPPGAAGYIVSADAHPSLRHEVAALDDALPRLRAAGARIDVVEVDACLPCRGGSEALLEANRRLLSQLTLVNAGERVFASKLQGVVSVHPSAEVRSSVIRGPVVIGAGARVSNAYIGPYTAIGRHCVIEGAEVEHSILLEGSTVRGIDGRMESSLLGRDVHISRSHRQPRAYRFMVGDNSEIGIL